MALGGHTQAFRSYGKRKTNVINRRADLGHWDSPPSPVPACNVASSSWSSSSDSDSDAAAPAPALPIPPKPRARPTRPSFEIVIDKTAQPRPSLAASRPSQPVRERTAAQKENTAPRARTSKSPVKGSAARKVAGKSKAVELSESDECDDDDEVDRSPLEPKPKPRAAAPARTYGSRKSVARPAVVVDSSSSSAESSESDQVVVAKPVRRARAVARSSGSSAVSGTRRVKAPVIVSDDDGDAHDSSLLVEDRPTPSFADELASSASDTDEVEVVKAALRAPAPSTADPLVSRRGYASSHALPPSFSPLLPHLLHPAALTFASLFSAPPLPFAQPCATSGALATSAEWRKIGEASYSEVFATTDAHGDELVVKVIPIASPRSDDAGARAQETEAMPFMSECEAVRREIEVSRAMGGEEGGVEGFVRFKGAYIVQGSYPAELLEAWDDFKHAQYPPSDEQIRPHVLPTTQLYALLLLENAGSELETYKLRTWVEAASVLAQAVDALARAEEHCGFEHRDLHWGNILLAPTAASTSPLESRLSTLSLSGSPSSAVSLDSLSDPAASGIRATLIDFTLSRCTVAATSIGSSRARERVLFDPFEDEELFEGEGDYQFDVYRLMRALVQREGGEWEGEHRRTNVLWLHYLVLKLLHSEHLRPPSSSRASALDPSSPLRRSSLTSATHPSSPNPRTVSSPVRPRAPLNRRYSSLAPTSASSALSPLPAAPRKARTLPASLLPGGRKHALLVARERGAYDALVRAEGVLERAISGWGLKNARTRRGAAAGRKAGVKGQRRMTRVTTEEENDSDVSSAADFARRWFARE
ncbi:hypothetical protein Rhopal_004836-T1 [Rhodotorula paludigena]|uniref:non-specific serine/threonine protein kinase n=1 Tax=Rhodotorula paludigena TaxID=86838 RepID=A0AAV5GNP9_9BASI|nr:hypothetical protein Rhopal_004836-T1 [Rhodotorula paludigena]